jgi:hypothetical protein
MLACWREVHTGIDQQAWLARWLAGSSLGWRRCGLRHIVSLGVALTGLLTS